MPEREEGEGTERLRAMWSGVITFGLVSIPVDLHTATRPRGFALRMLGPDGVPLARRYYCPEHQRFVERDEIVRGHEEEEGGYLTVDEEELAALEPKRSREIDLQRFVPRDSIPPLFLDRPYVLVPGGETSKAYRLLAATMERTDRAGIATFVMRGHSYLVAITSDAGILRAQLLRYADEVRSPEDVGLPAPKKGDAKRKKRFAATIRKAAVDELDPAGLESDEKEALLALAEKKEKEGEVVEAPDAGDETTPAGDVIDLMELLKERLLEGGEAEGQKKPSRGNGKRPRRSRVSAKKRPSAASFEGRTKEELYEEARKLDIAGRSKMSKDELARAIAKSA